MRSTVLTLLFIAFSTSTFSQSDPLSKTRQKYDDMREITWYYNKSPVIYSNQTAFFCYIGKMNNISPWLRIRIQYKGTDWLFINSYLIKVDGRTYEIDMNKYGEIEREVITGGVLEWLDRLVENKELEILKAVAYGTSVKLRYVGDTYYHDVEITEKQKVAIRNVLDAYVALGGSIE